MIAGYLNSPLVILWKNTYSKINGSVFLTLGNIGFTDQVLEVLILQTGNLCIPSLIIRLWIHQRRNQKKSPCLYNVHHGGRNAGPQPLVFLPFRHRKMKILLHEKDFSFSFMIKSISLLQMWVGIQRV